MQNFIAQSMRRMGLATDNKVTPVSPNTGDRAAASSKAPLAHMEIGSKWSYSTLEYPMDIQARSDLGHYMMFYVNIATDSSYSRMGSTNKRTQSAFKERKSAESHKDPAQKAVLNGGGFSEKQQGSAPDATGS